MHKYFAKPLFLGKKVEFLPECHSTNEELLSRLKKDEVPEGLVIHTDHQLAGKGQRGNAWMSEPGRNLLFSLLLKPKTLSIKHSFYLNIISGLAVSAVLSEHYGLVAELKWPNDVYVKDQKIAGILVETTLVGHLVESAIVGVGLNVNQSHFSLPTATSLLLALGKSINRNNLLEQIISKIEGYYLLLKSSALEKIQREYYDKMRWRGELHYFKDEHGSFEGEIIGIDETGRLLIKTHQAMRRFDVKQITFLH